MQFPYDFGSIPRTHAEDGDALEVVLMEEPTFPGCLMTVRLLGVLRAIQQEGTRCIRNDRLIAIAQNPVNQPAARSLRDLDAAVPNEIEHFFVSYNRVQGRELKPTSKLGPAPAHTLLKQSMRAFEKKEDTARHER